MREQRVDGDLVALHDAEDAGRQARLGEQLGHEQRGRRVLLARLEDERVAARERERVHPHRDHRREVERRDPGDDAERLAVARRVDARGDLLRALALHQLRDPAGELDDLQAALHLAARVVEGLAVLARDDAGEVVAARGEQLAVGEHDGRALGERGGAPAGERRARRAGGAVDVGGGGERDPPRDLAGRGVVDVAEALGRRVGRTVDPVADGLEVRGSERHDPQGTRVALARWRRLPRMCRLFARVAAQPYPATFGLLEAPDSVEAQSRREPDGYGIGSFDRHGAPHVIRRAKAAYQDRAFPQEAHELRSRIFVAHIRFATNGANLERNTHPFIQHGRIFAHNGVVHGLDELEARLRPEYRALVAGETDSERVFALITQEIDDHGGDVTAGIVAATTWIAATLPLYAVNLLLATADELWALRYPETHDLLWLDEREEPATEHRDRRRRLRFGVDVPAPGIAVASEAMTPGDAWTPLRSGELLHVAADLTPTVTTVLPDAPAKPLTLADLDVHAAAAQQEK